MKFHLINILHTHFYLFIIYSAENQIKAGQSGAIEVILDLMKMHISIPGICECGCNTLKNIVLNCKFVLTYQYLNITICNSVDNKLKAVQYGVIDIVLNTLRTHISNPDVCKMSCGVLYNISNGNYSFQKEICEKKGLTILADVMKRYNDSIELLEACCSTVGTILSSQETYPKFYSPDVMNTFRECSERNKNSKLIKQFFLGSTRTEDLMVKDAIKRGICTKGMFPKCCEECECDKGIYCPECCIQQKAFKCHTCDANENVYYCETCWKRDHQGHKCEEFFYPIRCGTK